MEEKKYFAKKSYIPGSPCKTPQDVMKFCKEHDVQYVDLKFMDFIGLWQHFSVPICEIDESTFEDGKGFDGSSIRGWKSIESSDMLIIPDAKTAMIDPFCDISTLSIICDVEDPITRERYSRDPRNIARNAEDYLKSTGIGDTAFVGPEAEFFIFN